MDLEPFKNKNNSIHEKEKIRFIWAKIKPLIHDKIKRVGVLLWITTYADFKWAVLNTKDTVRN